MRRCRVGLAILFALIVCSATRAEEFRSPDGFSLSYPTDWLAFSDEQRPEKVPASVADWIARCKVDFGQTSVMLIRPSSEDFLEYVKIAPTKYLAVNNFNLTNLVGNSQDQFQSQGMGADIWEARVRQVGGNSAMVLDYKVRSSLSSDPLHVRQYYFSKDGKSFLVTCTAKWSSFGTYASAFEGIAGSLKFVPQP
jgi:hypothetical protein